jgi:hypothetical protein
MAHEKIPRKAKPRCDNCCFSTFAIGTGRAVLICRQKKGSVGNWYICSPLDHCPNFYPSRFALRYANPAEPASPAKHEASSPQNQTPRLIPLTRGQFAIVDAEDYPRLSRFTWFAEGRPNNYYAVRKENGRSIKMHRQIMGLTSASKAIRPKDQVLENSPSTSTAKNSTLKTRNRHRHFGDGMVVDHIDHNGLNNQKKNLRICTFAENCRNLRSSRHKNSKYKGVHWHKRRKKWAAQISCNNKTYHLGYFTNEIEAAKAYDRAAKKYHGKFASLNFNSCQKIKI